MQTALVHPPVVLPLPFLDSVLLHRVQPKVRFSVFLPSATEVKPVESKLSRLLKLSQPGSVYGTGTAAEIDGFIHSLRD